VAEHLPLLIHLISQSCSIIHIHFALFYSLSPCWAIHYTPSATFWNIISSYHLKERRSLWNMQLQGSISKPGKTQKPNTFSLSLKSPASPLYTPIVLGSLHRCSHEHVWEIYEALFPFLQKPYSWLQKFSPGSRNSVTLKFLVLWNPINISLMKS
jgi:hypothetical protein